MHYQLSFTAKDYIGLLVGCQVETDKEVILSYNIDTLKSKKIGYVNEFQYKIDQWINGITNTTDSSSTATNNEVAILDIPAHTPIAVCAGIFQFIGSLKLYHCFKQKNVLYSVHV